MIVKILLIIVACYVAFEIVEHLVLPLIWLAMGKKKKPVTGAPGLIGEVAEVMEWQGSKGKVFIHGEIWWAECDVSLKPGDKAIVEDVERLVLKVTPQSQPL
jgi:membrane-bound serine protease (ClpP class)